jgi:hypothetical protein
MKMDSVSIHAVRGEEPIIVIGWHDPGYPGLVVLRDPRYRKQSSYPWSVFHITSGLSAVPDSIGGFRTRAQAVQYARGLAGIAEELGFTWRLRLETMDSACKDAVRSRVLDFVRSILSGNICEGVSA